jgi:hypothetical protein
MCRRYRPAIDQSIAKRQQSNRAPEQQITQSPALGDSRSKLANSDAVDWFPASRAFYLLISQEPQST